MKNVTTFGLSLSLALVASGSFATVTKYKATLTGAQQNPAVTTSNSGSATATYDDVSKLFTYTVTHTIPTGQLEGAHAHGAPAGKDGPVQFNLAGGGASPSSEAKTLDDTQAAFLTGGNLYFNLHTKAHSGGELRGQIELDTSSGVDGGTIGMDGGSTTDGGMEVDPGRPDDSGVEVITTPADGGGSTGSTSDAGTSGGDDADADDSSCSMGRSTGAGAFSIGLLGLGLAALVRSKKSKR